MSSFFKALALLMKDRQEFRLDATKVKDDLVLMITPDRKGSGKVTHVTVPNENLLQENIDSEIFGTLNAPDQAESPKFQATTTAGSKEQPEKKETSSSTKKPSAKSAAKKKAASKAPAKKSTAKKSAAKPAKKENPKKGLAALLGKKETGLGAVIDNKAEEPKQEAPDTHEAETTMADVDRKFDEAMETIEKLRDCADDVKNKKKQFSDLVAEGKAHFVDRKYRLAEQTFAKALEIFPDDEKVKKGHANALKWANAVERMLEGNKTEPATT